MHSPTEPTKRRLSSILLSVLLHSSAIALLLVLAAAAARHRVVPPPGRPAIALLEFAGASHAIDLPLPPSNFTAHTHHPTPEAEATHKTILPLPPTPQRTSGGGKPAQPHSGDGSGAAQRGTGSDAEDARPSFPVFSPRPAVVDRSLLPATEQKVVVDVNVDALGQVTSETLVHGLGNKLDQMVLDIVRTWRFQPATVDGKPIASQAELIFPFNQDYPITVS